MSKSLMSKVANALSFAHLAGLGAAARAEAPPEDPTKKDDELKAEDKDDPAKKRDDETADEYAARMEGAPSDEDGDDKDKEKAAAANAEALAQARAEGAKAERERGAAIFASPAAARNVALAAEFAFTTDLAADRCVALLERAPATGLSRPDRSARNPALGVGGAPAPDPKQATAARWDANLQAARGPSRR